MPDPRVSYQVTDVLTPETKRCESAHYLSQQCCQLNAGHDGPHMAQFRPWGDWVWPGKYRVWEHDTNQPLCNQRDVQ